MERYRQDFLQLLGAIIASFAIVERLGDSAHQNAQDDESIRPHCFTDTGCVLRVTILIARGRALVQATTNPTQGGPR